MQNKKHKDAH